jgi:hypothetical protein
LEFRYDPEIWHNGLSPRVTLRAWQVPAGSPPRRRRGRFWRAVIAIITNYATLQTEVANFLARDDLTADIPLFIQMAENKLHASLHLRNEETALSVDVSSGVAAVPTDFKKLKFAYYVNGSTACPLEWKSLNQLYRDHPDRSDTGIPQAISREAGNFVFGKIATDGTAVLKGVYYAKQDPLRTTDPSWYVTNHPEILLYGSLLEATPFIQDDPRLVIWGDFYKNAVLTIEDENDAAEVSGGSLRAIAS